MDWQLLGPIISFLALLALFLAALDREEVVTMRGAGLPASPPRCEH